MCNGYASPWWHPLGDGDPQAEVDDSRAACPKCHGEGCSRCGWTGSIETMDPDSEPENEDA